MRLAKPRPLTCPQCGKRIWRGSLSRSLNKRECPFCRTHLRIAGSYELFIGTIGIISAALIGIATHTQASDGAWLLGVIAATAVIYVAALALIPPWLQLGSYQAKLTVVSSFLGATMVMFFVNLTGFGGFILLAGSKQDLRRHLAMLSAPLTWASPNFLVTPESSYSQMCGVLLGNSFFYGLTFFACYKFVHRAFRRARLTQLSLSGKNPTEENE